MKKSKYSFYFLFVAFFTFITIFVTIVQKSYSNLMNPIKEVQKNNLLKPISPNLDLDVIQQVESKPEYSIVDLETNISSDSSDSNTL